ncbi:MAG: hypothetical protein ABI622_01895 [Chloroflexota bacterium]
MAPGLLAGPSLDAAVFTLAAERLVGGVLPYVGTWDHKPPGIYAVHAVAIALVGWLGAWPAVWLATVTCVGGAAAFVAAAARSVVGPRIAAIAGLAVAAAMSQFIVSLGGGLTEPIAVLPLAASFWRAATAGGAPLRWLAAGGLAALALVISLPALAVVAALIVLALRSPTPLRAVALGLTGAAIVALAVLGALAAGGILDDAVRNVIGYNAAYRAASAPAASTGAAPQIAGVVLSFLFLIFPAALGLLAARRRRPARTAALASLAWLGTSVVLFAAQGRFETHYAIPLAIPLAWLAAVGLDEAAGAWRRGGPARLLGAVPIGLAVVLSAAVISATAPAMVASVTAENRRVDLIGAYIRDRSSAAATVFVWGNEPQIYLAADRAPASPYVYLYPLTTPGYSSPQQVAEILAAWTVSPPAIIIDAGSFTPGTPGDPPLLLDRPVASDGRDYDALDPLRAFVRDRYALEVTLDGWPLYRRVGS